MSNVRFQAVITLTPTSYATVNILMRIPLSLFALLSSLFTSDSSDLPHDPIPKLIGYVVTVVGALMYAFASRLDSFRAKTRPSFKQQGKLDSSIEEISSSESSSPTDTSDLHPLTSPKVALSPALSPHLNVENSINAIDRQ